MPIASKHKRLIISKMNRIAKFLILFSIFISCQKESSKEVDSKNENTTFISGVDISSYPEIAKSNPNFYDLSGNHSDLLTVLKENGVNTVRLRLWVNPTNEHSSFDEVKQFSNTLKTNGFKIWLTVHYSDTWADPGKQVIPSAWEGMNFTQLKEIVYNYTEKTITELQPDYIQIGNEINTGFLHPYGRIPDESEQCIELMENAILAVRTNTNQTKIILHYAGIDGADWFFNKMNVLDYDIIGLSYYPIYHGKSIENLSTILQNLSNSYDKQIVIAETAYPFTIGYNDDTNNIVGLNEQLILPKYPATSAGQRNFIKDIKTIIKDLNNGIGFCYWGAELIAFKGNQSNTGSPWENQALFDFNNTALPVLREFRTE